jgi:hypothetical protein
MQAYIDQLLDDIREAEAAASFPANPNSGSIFYFISEEEEDRNARVRQLDEWTGIRPEMLPAQGLLSDDQVCLLQAALEKMLEAYNCHFTVQFTVPERIKYETIRQNIDQEVKVRTYHMGFFNFCKPGTASQTCAMGEYCHCAFFEELFSRFEDEDLTPEEERQRKLGWEVERIKRKYGDDWMKYYPYYLDANYDDDYGNPYDYGFGDDEDDDDWWRR